jgi:hypothetical protein
MRNADGYLGMIVLPHHATRGICRAGNGGACGGSGAAVRYH